MHCGRRIMTIIDAIGDYEANPNYAVFGVNGFMQIPEWWHDHGH